MQIPFLSEIRFDIQAMLKGDSGDFMANTKVSLFDQAFENLTALIVETLNSKLKS